MLKEIEVPEIGENVESGVVVAVHIKVGDMVAVDDTVIELETDKALVEIPSPFEGRIEEVLAKEGAQMKVGEVIARVEAGSKDDAASADDESDDGDAADERKPEQADEAADRKAGSAGQESSDKTPETPDVDEKTENGATPESPPEKEKRQSS
ncbi:MAG: biotin/lipoyl-containing protein, partial [Desulfosarcina sp.]